MTDYGWTAHTDWHSRGLAAAVAAGGLDHVVTVSLDRVDGVGGTYVLPEILDATIVMDEGWSPHTQAQIVAPIPELDVLTWLDPRRLVRATVRVTYAPWPLTGVPVEFPWRLWVRSRRLSRGGDQDTMTLELASAEAVLQDASPWDTSYTYTASTAPRAALDHLVAWASSSTCAVFTDGPDPAVSTLGAEVTVAPGDDMWAKAQDLSELAGGWLRSLDTQELYWSARPDDWTTAHGDDELVTYDGGLILTVDATNSRDGWADAIQVVSEWTDTAGVDHKVTGSARDLTIPAPHKTLTVRNDVKSTTTANTRQAAALLRRMKSRGREVTLTTVGRYWQLVGDQVRLFHQSDPLNMERALVARVEHRPLQGITTLTVRDHPDESANMGG
ncbi:hypothetical protein [Actinotalea sp.]|uniref:hypothetical protein n=1 Tax=Actinotalea sp. TaxID=1872145 RepID=UPI0035642D3F